MIASGIFKICVMMATLCLIALVGESSPQNDFSDLTQLQNFSPSHEVSDNQFNLDAYNQDDDDEAIADDLKKDDKPVQRDGFSNQAGAIAVQPKSVKSFQLYAEPKRPGYSYKAAAYPQTLRQIYAFTPPDENGFLSRPKSNQKYKNFTFLQSHILPLPVKAPALNPETSVYSHLSGLHRGWTAMFLFQEKQRPSFFNLKEIS